MIETTEYKDPATGRLYKAHQDGEAVIPIGPPDGLVDSLNLPEPFATTLHNVLYQRGIFTFADAARPRALQGALQEALNLDVQRLAEAFSKFEKEEVVT
jgi:hypothetical protein